MSAFKQHLCGLRVGLMTDLTPLNIESPFLKQSNQYTYSKMLRLYLQQLITPTRKP